MDLQLTGKRAIITGGSKGIGLAIAHALATEGVDVVLAARNQETLEKAAAEVAERTGRRAIPVVADTGTTSRSRPSSLVPSRNSAASTSWSTTHRIRRSARRSRIWRAPPTRRSGDVNVKVVGDPRAARAVAPHLKAQGWGRIINISGLGYWQTHSIVRSIRNVSVAALTKNLADELGPHGINVTVVHPGQTRTESKTAQFEAAARAAGIDVADYERQIADNAIGRVVDAAEVADVVAFLASPRSVSITGDAVAVGGGLLGTVNY